MLSLKIIDIKETMAALLIGNVFDDFFVDEAQVTTFTKLILSGQRNLSWYEGEEKEKFSTKHIFWKEIKPMVCSYIEGKKTPSSFRISLIADGDFVKIRTGMEHISETGDYLIHFRFSDQELFVVTGCAYREFTMDKENEYAWDTAVKCLFKEKKLSFEESV